MQRHSCCTTVVQAKEQHWHGACNVERPDGKSWEQQQQQQRLAIPRQEPLSAEYHEDGPSMPPMLPNPMQKGLVRQQGSMALAGALQSPL